MAAALAQLEAARDVRHLAHRVGVAVPSLILDATEASHDPFLHAAIALNSIERVRAELDALEAAIAGLPNRRAAA